MASRLVSIRNALLAGAMVTFVPLVTATGFVIWNQAQETERQIAAAMLSDASALAHSIEASVAKGRDALTALSQTRYIEQRDFASLHEAAVRIQSTHDACFNIVLLRTDGQQVLNTLRRFGEPLPNTFESARESPEEGFEHLQRTGSQWVRAGFDGAKPVMSDVYFGPVAGRPIASLTVPVMRGGRVVYVWLYGFDLLALQKRFAAQVHGADALAVVLDRRGIIVARDARRAGLIGQPGSATIRAVAAGEASAGSNRGMTLEGVEVYRAAVKTSDGWTVAVARPYRTVNELVQKAGFWWAALSGLTLLFGMLVVLWLTKQVAAPLQRLASAAAEVHEGRAPQLATRIREIGLLRNALSEAAEARNVAIRLSLLEGIVHHAPVGIALFDRELRFVLLNERAAEADGVPIAAHLGKRVPEVIGRFGDAIELQLRKVRDTGQPVSLTDIHGETPAQPGKKRWWIADYFPLKDAHGVITHVAAVALEITGRKEAEEKLREADERKDVYLATLAHELRNPLAPIRNAVAILRRKGPAEPELMWAREVIDRQATQMARLLDELLEVSRIARGKLVLRKAIFDLRDAVRDGLEMAKPLLEQNEHSVHVDTPDSPVWIDGDRVRLSQVLVNLLTNAAKYTERRGQVTVRLAIDGSEAAASVEDNGLGIAPDMLDRIFQPFAQSQATLHRAQGGLGIGLALVKGIVDLHGGSVRARSAGLGRGSMFLVRLPISGAPSLPAEGAASRTLELPQSMRVVVADDNRDSADSLAFLIRAAGADVSVAYDGIAALGAIRGRAPDVVVMDVGMPGMNGYDVAQTLGALPAKPFLIALTGWGQDSDRASAFQAGFNRHFTKPVQPEDLLQLLAEIAATKKA
jgi:PAS domain S-box-containing protein